MEVEGVEENREPQGEKKGGQERLQRALLRGKEEAGEEDSRLEDEKLGVEEGEQGEQSGSLPEGVSLLPSLEEEEVSVEGEEKAWGLRVEVEGEEEQGREEEGQGEGPSQGEVRALQEEGEKGEEEEEQEGEAEGEDRPEDPRGEPFDQQIPRDQQERRAGGVEGIPSPTLLLSLSAGVQLGQGGVAVRLQTGRVEGGVLLGAVVVPQVQVAVFHEGLGHEDVVGLVPSEKGEAVVEEGERGCAEEKEEAPGGERGKAGEGGKEPLA